MPARRSPARAGVTADVRTVLIEAMSEASWLLQVREWADRGGWYTWHDNATNAPRRCPACGSMRRGARNACGLPDLLLWRAGRHIVAELKAEGGRLTDTQRAMLDRYRAAGIPAYVWRPSDHVQVFAVLLDEALGQPTPEDAQ
jgi:hypothetical protein